MKEQVLKQSRVFWKGLEQADTAAMRSVCDDKCFFVHIGGNCDLDREMDAFEKKVFQPTEIVLHSQEARAFGEKDYPRPGAVIMQYTGLSEVYDNEPPTYNCVGTNDGIASYRTMERRIAAIQANGTDAMIEVFPGLPHGFGLGTGTVADGWINNAVAFWERNMK